MNEMMMPAFSLNSIGIRGNRVFRHIAANRHIENFRSGRLAIAHALLQSGLRPGCEVLLPAYHCTSIIDPITALGGQAVFYNLSADLRPELDDIAKKANSKTTSIIAIHYFGFSADLADLRDFCDTAEVTLIEDCAHCFSYCENTPDFGNMGDFVVTSPRKFLPIFDGGELISSRTQTSISSRHISGIRYQLKIAANTAERARNARTVGARIETILNNDPQSADSRIPSDALEFSISGIRRGYLDPRFDYAHIGSKQSVSGATLTRILSLQDVVRRRKRNFASLKQASQSFRKASAFSIDAKEPDTPYVFPLMLGESDDLHGRLRQIGVPMWRWQDLTRSECKTSNRYRYRLVQLPCHQSLESSDMEDMIDRLMSVLS